MRPLGNRPWEGHTLPLFYLPEFKQLLTLKAKKLSGKQRRTITLLKHPGKSLQQRVPLPGKDWTEPLPMGRYMLGPALEPSWLGTLVKTTA